MKNYGCSQNCPYGELDAKNHVKQSTVFQNVSKPFCLVTYGESAKLEVAVHCAFPHMRRVWRHNTFNPPPICHTSSQCEPLPAVATHDKEAITEAKILPRCPTFIGLCGQVVAGSLFGQRCWTVKMPKSASQNCEAFHTDSCSHIGLLKKINEADRVQHL